MLLGAAMAVGAGAVAAVYKNPPTPLLVAKLFDKARTLTGLKSSTSEDEKRDAAMRACRDEDAWISAEELSTAALDAGIESKDNDLLLVRIPQDQRDKIRQSITGVRSWKDFANVFDRHALGRSLSLPAERLPSTHQALLDANREIFTVRVQRLDASMDAAPEAIAAKVSWGEAKLCIASALASIMPVPPERALDFVLRCASRTYAGGDSWFVCSELLAGDDLLLTPAPDYGQENFIAIDIFLDGVISIATVSLFHIRSVHRMDAAEMMELRATHIFWIDTKLPFKCQRHLLLESPTSRMAGELDAIADKLHVSAH